MILSFIIVDVVLRLALLLVNMLKVIHKRSMAVTPKKNDGCEGLRRSCYNHLREFQAIVSKLTFSM